MILEKVAVEVFDRMLFENYAIELNEQERAWFAVDGKELRGSIEKGAKRGEAVVQAVAHKDLQVVAQDYYSGAKASEVPTVRRLLEESGLAGEKVSLDALHCKALTLEIISQGGGKYLVGLKENQKELKKAVRQTMENQAYLWKTKSLEKGHGRIEIREYEIYDLLEMKRDERWERCQIKTAVKIRRERVAVKSGKSSLEESYYLSNEVGRHEEICQAVRQHWTVETNNHIRDVSLKEDKMRSKKRNCSAQWEA